MILRKWLFRIVLVAGATGLTVLVLYIFNPDRQAMTSPDHPVCLVNDSPEVDALIVRQRHMLPQEQKQIDRYLDDSRKIRDEIEHEKKSELVTDAQAKLKELNSHPERYIGDRIAFVNAMRSASCTMVPANSYGEFLDQREGARCGAGLFQTSDYIKVRITSGPAKGTVGWGCAPSDIVRTVAMP